MTMKRTLCVLLWILLGLTGCSDKDSSQIVLPEAEAVFPFVKSPCSQWLCESHLILKPSTKASSACISWKDVPVA